MRKMGGAAVFVAVNMGVAGCGGGLPPATTTHRKALNPHWGEQCRRLYIGGPVHEPGPRLHGRSHWRAPCIPEAQARIHEEYGPRGVEVIIVHVDPTENERDLLRFKEQCSDAVSARSRKAGQS